MVLGQRIKYYRQLNRLSQEELGEKIKADARTICNYETGKYKPSANTIVLLAKAFQISTDKLLVECSYDRVEQFFEEKEWTDLFLEIASLEEQDKKVIKDFLNYVMAKKKVQPEAEAIAK